VITFDITNAHTPGKVSVQATKTWDDGNDKDGFRTDATLHLLKNGKAVEGQDKTIAKDATGNALTATWTDLDKFEDGKAIVYTVSEDAMTHYTTSISADTDATDSFAYTVTNTHEPTSLMISAQKTWVDNENQDNIRPTSVTYTLQSKVDDGNWQTADVADAQKTVSYDATWTNLPGYANGQQIHYQVVETKVNNYETAYSTQDMTATPTGGAQSVTVDVTNTHTTNAVTYTVHKAWQFGDIVNATETPASTSVRLYRRYGTGYSEVTEEARDAVELKGAELVQDRLCAPGLCVDDVSCVLHGLSAVCAVFTGNCVLEISSCCTIVAAALCEL
jgi:hypothetical protein